MDFKRLHVLKLVSDCASKFLFRHTVAVVDRKNSEISSGTYVKCRDRGFVVTAEHCIPPTKSRAWIVPPSLASSGAPSVEIIKAGSDCDLDIGYLEVLPEAMDRLVQAVPLPVSSLANLGSGNPMQFTILLGTPRELCDIRWENSTLEFTAKACGYCALPMAIEDWPIVPEGSREANSQTDIFLPFEGSGFIRSDSGAPLTWENPSGMSGGGVWNLHFEKGDVWAPSKAELFGIQTSWFKAGKYLRAIQIKHWVNLIKADYPNLRNDLEV